MPTFGRREATVLDLTHDAADYISLHTSYGFEDDDLATFLSRPLDMDEFVVEVAAMCDAARARKRSRKRIHLAFDEWNVWQISEGDGAVWNERWPKVKPLFEQAYSLADAVVVGLMLITLLRHADRVRIGGLAQLVNTIAPISTVPGGPAWRPIAWCPMLVGTPG